jgi:Bacterial membrane protein YfhO
MQMFPEKFPVPDNQPLAKHEKYPVNFSAIYQNQNLFYRQVTIAGYNPFFLNTFGDFLNSRLPDTVVQNPLCYLVQLILPYSMLEKDTTSIPERSDVYVSQNDFTILKNFEGAIEANESCRVTELKPNKMIAEADVIQPRLLIIQQNNFKGWSALVNKKTTPIYYANYCLTAIPLEKGKNLIEIHFQPPYIKWLAVMSAAVMLIIAGIILKHKIQ